MAGSTMYQLSAEPAVLRDKRTFKWLTGDVRTRRCVDLFGLYRNIEIAVIDAFGKPNTLNLYAFEGELRDSTLTVAGWFATLGNRSLPLTDKFPVLGTSYAPYLPIGFSLESMKLAKRGYHPSHVVPVEDYADVIVSHPKVTPRYLHEYTLCSANGYYVNSSYHEYGMRLYEAGNVIRRGGDIALGMLNFENIGKLTKIPVLTNMIHKVDESMSYVDSVIVNIGQPIANKTVGIVIGGHLHLLDGLLKIIGDQTIMFSLRRLRYVERIIASRNYLDLSDMGLDTVDINSMVSSLTSDDSVLKYLTGPHTFVVLIDNPNVYVEELMPDQTGRWGQYTMGGKAELGGLYDQTGQCIDYWPKMEMDQWSLDTLRDMQDSHLFRTSSMASRTRINDAAIGAAAWHPIVATMKYIRART